MNATLSCLGCRLVRAAMGDAPIARAADFDPFDLISAVVVQVTARWGTAVGDVVVVVGARGFGLPGEEDAPGPFVFTVARREDLAAWSKGDLRREAVLAGLEGPLPAGRVWCLVAFGTPERGAVTLIHHTLQAPTAWAVRLAELATVPDGGGPAPGRVIMEGGRS